MNRIDAASVLALATSPHRTRLTRLSISSDEIAIDTAYLEALAASPHLARFTELCLDLPDRIDINTALARALAALFRPPRPPLTVWLGRSIQEEERQALREALADNLRIEFYPAPAGMGLCLEG
jgi:hypothetical protein